MTYGINSNNLFPEFRALILLPLKLMSLLVSLVYFESRWVYP